MDTREKRLEALETTTVVFWFLFDGFWLLKWQLPTVVFTLVTWVFAAAIFAYVERKAVPMLVCAADTAWLLTNSFWAFGDMPKPEVEWCLTTAKVFFVLGCVLFTVAFLKSGFKKAAFDLLLRRFRIMRNLRNL